MKFKVCIALALSALSLSSALAHAPQESSYETKGTYAFQQKPDGSTHVTKVDFIKLIEILKNLDGFNKDLMIKINRMHVDIKNQEGPNQESSWSRPWILIVCAGIGAVAFLGGKWSAQERDTGNSGMFNND